MRTIGDRWMVGLDDFVGLFQPWCFCDSLIPKQKKHVMSVKALKSEGVGRMCAGMLFLSCHVGTVNHWRHSAIIRILLALSNAKL